MTETESPRSPLEVTYDEVQANPWVCENNPLASRPDVLGNLTLWEGLQNPKDKSSPVFRVIKTKMGSLRFDRFNKRDNEWRMVPELPKRRFFRRKSEGVELGVIRIELFDNPSRTVRTVG